MNRRRTGWLTIALVVALLVGVGGAAHAAVTPTLIVQAIGKGTVTGTGINCGVGQLQCFAAYGSTGTVDLVPTAATGWTFDHWTDDATACSTTPTCPMPVTAGTHTATAVFKPTGGGAVTLDNFNVALTGKGTVTNGSTDYPINCTTAGGTCSLATLDQSTLTVTEQPDAGYIFSSWGGACSGARVSCSVFLNADKAVGASFASAATNTLSVTVVGNGNVTGGGISCGAGATCTAQEPPNATVTLTESPYTGYAFTGWDGPCTGTQATCTVTMDAARTVTANFGPLVPLVVTVNGNGTVTGAGITCGPGPKTCTTQIAPNQTINLTGTPGVSGTSVTWTGCTSTAGAYCQKTVTNQPVSITATFAGGAPPPSTVSLTVDVSGDGYVMSTGGTTAIYCTAAGGAGCTTTVTQGTSVTLKAVPASGSTADFQDWSGDCNAFTSTTCTLTMSSAMTAGADFSGNDTTYPLTASLAGSGSGAVTGAGLHCTATGGTGCSSPQAAGATVTLTAQPSFGSTFTGWSGACSGTSPTCNVQMSVAKSVTATFEKSAPGKQLFSITVDGKGSVKGSAGTCTSKTGKPTTCVQQYDDGAKVTLTAKPAAGWAFSGWKGACTGGKTTCTLTMAAALATTATFTPLALAPGHKPTVTHTSSGTRITLYYIAHVAGTLKLTGTLNGATVVSHTKHITKGAGRLVVTVQKRGTYRFTLSLTAKGKTTKVRWVVKA